MRKRLARDILQKSFHYINYVETYMSNSVSIRCVNFNIGARWSVTNRQLQHRSDKQKLPNVTSKRYPLY